MWCPVSADIISHTTVCSASCIPCVGDCSCEGEDEQLYVAEFRSPFARSKLSCLVGLSDVHAWAHMCSCCCRQMADGQQQQQRLAYLDAQIDEARANLAGAVSAEDRSACLQIQLSLQREREALVVSAAGAHFSQHDVPPCLWTPIDLHWSVSNSNACLAPCCAAVRSCRLAAATCIGKQQLVLRIGQRQTLHTWRHTTFTCACVQC